MVSKAWRDICNHIASAIRGWKNNHRTDLPGNNRKRATPHRDHVVARRHPWNDEIDRVEEKLRVTLHIARFNCARTTFGHRNFRHMTEHQIERAYHCFDAYQNQLFKLKRAY